MKKNFTWVIKNELIVDLKKNLLYNTIWKNVFFFMFDDYRYIIFFQSGHAYMFIVQ